MQEVLSNIDTLIVGIIESLGIYGPIFGCILILFESMIPILPLSVFITLNFYTFGHIIGFLISYILTVMGCSLSFWVCRKFLGNRFEKLTKKFDRNRALKLVKKFSSIKFKHLVLLMAFPFTPAFMINIFAGVSKMEYKKFLTALMVAKPFMVYFWGYLGITLIESLTHPVYFIKVALLVIIAYVASTIINKKFDLD